MRSSTRTSLESQRFLMNLNKTLHLLADGSRVLLNECVVKKVPPRLLRGQLRGRRVNWTMSLLISANCGRTCLVYDVRSRARVRFEANCVCVRSITRRRVNYARVKRLQRNNYYEGSCNFDEERYTSSASRHVR